MTDGLFTYIASVCPAAASRCRLFTLVLCLLVPLASLDAAPPRIRALPRPSAGSPGFTKLVAPDIGIDFTNHLAEERAATNRNLVSGSGVTIGDIDGDGLADLFLGSIDGPNALYRNLGGWKFTNITAAALPGVSWLNPTSGYNDSTGAAFADIDGDGDLDLFVNMLGGGTRLFVNDGTGRFAETTDAAGLRSKLGATSMALADVDGDGDLDLYVARFRPTTVLDQPNTTYQLRQTDNGSVVIGVNGRPVTSPDLTNRFEMTPGGEVQEFGEPDSLFLNDGKGVFAEVSWVGGAFLNESGTPLRQPYRDWGLAVHFHDLNADGRPDIYICNDLHTPDRIWMNETGADRILRFRELSPLALRSNPTFSMGADFADFDRDGTVDFFAVDMFSRNRAWRHTQMAGLAPMLRLPGQYANRAQVQRNVLQINRGDGTWADTAWQAGVEASEWSWGPVALDVDLDGFEDIIVPNGEWRDFQDSDGANRISEAQKRGELKTSAQIAAIVQTFPKLATPNSAFRNRGDATFDYVSKEWGFLEDSISQGVALGDLDGDGDIDLVTNDLMSRPAIYRNNSAAGRIAVRLRGPAANTRGVGARIAIHAAGLPVQKQEMIAGGRYLGGDDAVRTFATGAAATATVEVTWRSGRVSRVADVPANSEIVIDESEAGAATASPAVSAPFFENVSDRIKHVHVDEPFDDFSRQPMLPARLSQLGPGVTWTDLNRDGHPDLVVGSGRTGFPGVFLNDGKGGFIRQEAAPFNRATSRDLTTILPLNGALISGVSNFEDGLTNGGALRLYDPATGRSGEMLLGTSFSTGPLAAADVDGDGELEVFVGGRSIPGRYPEPAPSLLLKNQGGRFVVHKRWESLGLVSGACFTDLDGDGHPDLVVAAEWSAPKFFRNDSGDLKEWTPELAAPDNAGLTGWWNSVTAGDFDGDGRMDLVLGNQGRNSRYAASSTAPRRIWYGDLGSGLGNDVIETWFDVASKEDRMEREYMMIRSLFPASQEAAPTYASYSIISFLRLFGTQASTARAVSADTLDSMVLMNRAGRFEARQLPGVAQWSSAFGLCVADYDGDGNEDVFLAQNSASPHLFSERLDAGRGLWLRGDGKGGFTPDHRSGVIAYGDGRGAAVADFDGDGRVDLALSQNGSATTLWRNTGARAGLRVRLAGPPGNPSAIGASVRLRYGERSGPWRELHLGAGYWSCDDPVVVLGKSGEPTAVEVRWPGGKTVAVPLKAGEAEVRLAFPQ
jgi:hypothetical protein